MRNASGRNYRNSSVIVDVAMARYNILPNVFLLLIISSSISIIRPIIILYYAKKQQTSNIQYKHTQQKAQNTQNIIQRWKSKLTIQRLLSTVWENTFHIVCLITVSDMPDTSLSFISNNMKHTSIQFNF